MKLRHFLFLAATFSFANGQASFAQTVYTPKDGVAEVCRLAEQPQYSDALSLVRTLRREYPANDDILDAEATIAILVGDTDVARLDFRSANQGSEDPLALYGLALCSMHDAAPSDALNFLSKIDPATITDPAISNELSSARAICLAAEGDKTAADELIPYSNGPASQELKALIETGPITHQISILQDFLMDAETDGVPAVVEPTGLSLGLLNNGPLIQPSVLEPEVKASFASRFSSPNAKDSFLRLSGLCQIRPPRPVEPGTAVVAVLLDGQSLGVTNSAPFQLKWNSRNASNGSHVLTYSMTNSSGTEIGIEEQTIEVVNACDAEITVTSETRQRMWALLRINPAYAVAEYNLALLYSQIHDAANYETHILRAAALNPEFQDIRHRLHPLFAGTVPAKFPVPDGTTLPSSLGLSAGKASATGFWAGSPRLREIALTFDDGPIPGPSKALLTALQSARARATFFVVGTRAAESPDSLRAMAAAGDDVEDHSFTHPNLTQVLPQHVLQEIVRTAVVIQSTTGYWPHFLRPPGGNTNPFVLATARACGMSGAFWTIDALPAEEAGSPDGVAKWVIDRARPGAIVLMHNGMASTVGSIPELVSGLRSKGYKLVTIRQLAYDAFASP